jgi:GR25 family glycosyltransferase involved in LPS biosynthesis
MTYNCLYINLAERVDRCAEFEKQVADLSGNGFHFERVNAIKVSPGFIGCTMSHLYCLKLAKKNGWDSVIIFEDDFEKIVSADIFKSQVDKIYAKEWDVFLLTAFVRECAAPVDGCARVSNAQTTVAYAVRSHYYDTLIENYSTGLKALRDNPSDYGIYGLDQYWKKLQTKDIWLISVPILGKQSIGYSDIENRIAQYDSAYIHSSVNKLLLPHKNS